MTAAFLQQAAALHRGRIVGDTDDAPNGVLVVGEFDGVWLTPRIRLSPMLEIYFPLRGMLGFRLDGRVTSSNCYALAHTFLDPASRRAIDTLPSRYSVQIGGGEVCVAAGKEESELDTFLQALRAGAVVASRPRRLAAEWARTAAALGGTVDGDDWVPGGGFAVNLTGAHRAVTMDFFLRPDAKDDERLHLHAALRCRRAPPRDDAWQLVRRSMPPVQQLAEQLSLAGRSFAARYRGSATDAASAAEVLADLDALIASVDPDSITVTSEQVTVVIGGSPGPAALTAAAELTGRLGRSGAGGHDVGPYR